MGIADRPEFLVDRQLIQAAWRTAAVLAVPAVLLAAALAGPGAAAGVLWGIAAIGGTATGAAWLSERGGHTSRGIGVVRVVAAVPARLAVVAALLALAVGPLGLPDRPTVLAVCACEIAVMARWSWLVLRGPVFVGPL